ncbi:hypothetical protein GJ496_001458 [Pomphorhynchus laevis]|nr:hypothetical protein GJ496_001458 [Pomphorhynchus laevis]
MQFDKLLNKSIAGVFDIAANLTDSMFNGVYHGKKYHESDIQEVVDRAINDAEMGGVSFCFYYNVKTCTCILNQYS